MSEYDALINLYRMLSAKYWTMPGTQAAKILDEIRRECNRARKESGDD